MLSMLSVDGAFRTNRSVAAETIVGELFFGVVIAGIGRLIKSLFACAYS